MAGHSPTDDPATIDKAVLLERLRQSAADELEQVTASQQATAAGATHAESRPENDKDTRALESSYLARGLASRVQDMRDAVAVLERLALREFDDETPIALTALVTLEDEQGQVHHFVAPAAGGQRLQVGEAVISVVTPRSPLGKVLIGKYAGDDVDVRTPSGTRFFSVAAVR